jgi:hypothetical protein
VPSVLDIFMTRHLITYETGLLYVFTLQIHTELNQPHHIQGQYKSVAPDIAQLLGMDAKGVQ